MEYLTLFCLSNATLFWWQWLQFLVSSQGVQWRYLMKFDSSCTSSLTRVVPKCTYCQKVVARIKRDCEVMDVSLWQERDYESLVRRHDQVFDCNCIRSIREFADNILMLTKNSHKQAKILIFFFGSLESHSQIPLSKRKMWLHIFCCSQGYV